MRARLASLSASPYAKSRAGNGHAYRSTLRHVVAMRLQEHPLGLGFDALDETFLQAARHALASKRGAHGRLARLHAIGACVTMDSCELDSYERNGMTITVANTHPDNARITLVGELQDGSFKAKVMTETDVPYTPYWDNLLEQRIVYIQPDDAQLDAILTALNERKLTLDELQNYGSSDGGTSEIAV